jgi:glycosyltransferase involved in cell wall biosynthesis
VKVGVFVGDTPPDAGGGFTIVDELMKAAASRPGRHEYVILTVGDTSPLEAAYPSLKVISVGPALTDGGLSRRAARFVGRKAAQALSLPPIDWGGYVVRPAVDNLLRQHGIDVVWYPSAWAILTFEIPFFTVVWDLQHRLQPFFPEVSAGGEWERRERHFSTLLQRAAMVIAGTEVGRDEIERFYGVARANIRIMPHPTPTFAAAAPPPEASGGDYIFYPAQFWAHKNHVNLLEALRLLRDRGESLRLVLTGSDKGNLGFVRETIARLGLDGAVELAGFAPRERLVSLYRGAVALTYVTFFGPENLPPLEAFALSCPVIASDVPGAREQLGDAALLVDPRRPDQIAQAVSNLRRDGGLRQQLVQRGLERAGRFRPSDFLQAIESWLDEFAAVRRCWPTA